MRLSRKKVIATATLVAVFVAPTLVAAQMPSVTPIKCASSAAPVKIASGVPSTATSAKAYFKAAGQQSEYYVDMRRAADGSMWAFIPSPLDSTPSFTYRVISMDVKNVQTSSQLFTAINAACNLPALTAAEQRVASNMVIGMTVPGQPVVPTGFQCRGVVSYITVGGEMRPNDECRRIAALGPQTGATDATSAGNGLSSANSAAMNASASNTAAGSSAAVSGGRFATGLSTGTIIALTAAAFGAGAVVEHNRQHQPVSPSRP
jgi:hypothetical protein